MPRRGMKSSSTCCCGCPRSCAMARPSSVRCTDYTRGSGPGCKDDAVPGDHGLLERGLHLLLEGAGPEVLGQPGQPGLPNVLRDAVEPRVVAQVRGSGQPERVGVQRRQRPVRRVQIHELLVLNPREPRGFEAPGELRRRWMEVVQQLRPWEVLQNEDR